MGLKNTFVNAANTIFNAVGDLKENVNYYYQTSVVYNVSAGTTENLDNGYIVSAVLSRYSKKQVDNTHVLNGDLKMITLQSELFDTPNLHDRVIRVESNTSVIYQVQNIEQDTANATWVMQLRKP